MRGWKNALLIWIIWLVAFTIGAYVLPDWLLVLVIVYMFVGDVICHNLRIRVPLERDRFDWRGTIRSLYWVLWWPYYLYQRR